MSAELQIEMLENMVAEIPHDIDDTFDSPLDQLDCEDGYYYQEDLDG